MCVYIEILIAEMIKNYFQINLYIKVMYPITT